MSMRTASAGSGRRSRRARCSRTSPTWSWGGSSASSRCCPPPRRSASSDTSGPDLLGPDWDADAAVANLRAHPDQPIGVALLDQRNLAGLGNVYRNELCYLRGVLPTRPVAEVDDLERMVELAHRLIDANKDRIQRSTTGNLRGQTDWVYGRDGQACSRCGTRILRGELGASELELRDTFWCPHCQR